MKKEETTKKADFKGAVSLEAIFASTSGKIPDTSIEKKEASKDKDDSSDLTETEEKKDTDDKEVGVKDSKIIESTITKPENSAYLTAKKLINLGLLNDFKIQISEEDEEGTLISEFSDMTEENLSEILKIQKEEKDNEISSKYISKEGLKDHQLKVIEILKNGGDLSKIAETPDKAFERPFEGFDLEDQQRQIDVLYTDLVSSKGLDHESAVTLIQKEIKSGTLKDSAIKIFELYREAHSKYIDEQLEEQRKDKEFKDLNFKENKKALVAKLKEAGLKESVYKKVSLEYSKKNSKGEFALIDKLRDILNKPEENYELILHLTDKSLFKDIFKIKSSNDTQRTIVRLATGVSHKGNKKSIKSVQSNEEIAPWLKGAQAYNETITNQNK